MVRSVCWKAEQAADRRPHQQRRSGEVPVRDRRAGRGRVGRVELHAARLVGAGGDRTEGDQGVGVEAAGAESGGAEQGEREARERAVHRHCSLFSVAAGAGALASARKAANCVASSTQETLEGTVGVALGDRDLQRRVAGNRPCAAARRRPPGSAAGPWLWSNWTRNSGDRLLLRLGQLGLDGRGAGGRLLADAARGVGGEGGQGQPGECQGRSEDRQRSRCSGLHS